MAECIPWIKDKRLFEALNHIEGKKKKGKKFTKWDQYTTWKTKKYIHLNWVIAIAEILI